MASFAVLTLLAWITNQLITPPGGFAFVDVPVSWVIHNARVSAWLRGTPHLMAIWSSSVGIHDMLEGRMLRLLTLYTKE